MGRRSDKSFLVKDGDFKASKYTFKGRKYNMCVKVAIKRRGVAVRDSKDPDKTTLFFNRGEWNAFIKGVKDGEFDV